MTQTLEPVLTLQTLGSLCPAVRPGGVVASSVPVGKRMRGKWREFLTSGARMQSWAGRAPQFSCPACVSISSWRGCRAQVRLGWSGRPPETRHTRGQSAAHPGDASLSKSRASTPGVAARSVCPVLGVSACPRTDVWEAVITVCVEPGKPFSPVISSDSCHLPGGGQAQAHRTGF